MMAVTFQNQIDCYSFHWIPNQVWNDTPNPRPLSSRTRSGIQGEQQYTRFASYQIIKEYRIRYMMAVTFQNQIDCYSFHWIPNQVWNDTPNPRPLSSRTRSGIQGEQQYTRFTSHQIIKEFTCSSSSRFCVFWRLS